MRPGGILGRLFTLLCLIGLVFAWPYVEGVLAGTWLFDLRLIVLVVLAALALSLLHVLEVRAAAWFSPAKQRQGDP